MIQVFLRFLKIVARQVVAQAGKSFRKLKKQQEGTISIRGAFSKVLPSRLFNPMRSITSVEYVHLQTHSYTNTFKHKRTRQRLSIYSEIYSSIRSRNSLRLFNSKFSKGSFLLLGKVSKVFANFENPGYKKNERLS